TKNLVFPPLPTLAAREGLSTSFEPPNHQGDQWLAAIFRDLFKAYPQVAVSSHILRLNRNSAPCRGRERARHHGNALARHCANFGTKRRTSLTIRPCASS